jgi:geranyl-CoA carboxylase beta subunit
VSFSSSWNVQGAAGRQRREAMLARVAQLRALEQRAADRSAQARPEFERRGQLLPRERLGLLLDPGQPFLPLCTLAGYLRDSEDPDASIPGGGVIAGIGFVRGVRCMVVASDSGIDAGALGPMGLDKMLRVQQIALQNKLPFLQLVESAGANLERYRVEDFVQGGALLRNLALLSAAGIPVITVQHGSGTGGDAYMARMSDLVIMVRDRPRALLSPVSTGELAPEGAELHSAVSGLGDYLAEDDREALGIAREVVARSALTPALSGTRAASVPLPLPLAGESWGEGRAEGPPSDDLLTLIPTDLREPLDMREVLVRLVDAAAVLEFKPAYGAATVCAQGSLAGHAVGFIASNGPIDAAGADKATHFIRWMCQLGHPIVYLQNTTGFLPGEGGGQGGMIRHGSSMIRAVSNASVPQLTILCGASLGAGNYAMCGRGCAPRFLFSWPSAKTGVMDGEQADAFHTSGLLLDDGVIDPRDTRAVLAFCLDTIAEAQARTLRPMQFGGTRMPERAR